MNAYDIRAAFDAALDVINATAPMAASGLLAQLLGRADDDEVADAHEFVLDTLSDADTVRTVNCITDSDLRSQVTIEQAERMAAEAETRRHGWWRN